MAEHSHEHQHHTSGQMGKHGRPYAKFWVNMVLGLVVMYFVMFSMIDGARDFRNNLNMLYMAVTMWAPMGIFMLATMPGMFPNRRLNLVLYGLFAVLTLGSFAGYPCSNRNRRSTVHRVYGPAPFGSDPHVPRGAALRSGTRQPMPSDFRWPARGDRADEPDCCTPSLRLAATTLAPRCAPAKLAAAM